VRLSGVWNAGIIACGKGWRNKYVNEEPCRKNVEVESF
jgi:hypothetical protein